MRSDVIVEVSESPDGSNLITSDFYAELALDESYHVDEAETIELEGLFDVSIGCDVADFSLKLLSQHAVDLFNKFVHFHFFILDDLFVTLKGMLLDSTATIRVDSSSIYEVLRTPSELNLKETQHLADLILQNASDINGWFA